MENSIQLPKPNRIPLKSIGLRILFAISMVIVIAVITYLDREGYRNITEKPLTFIDSIYYATVTITTTGYGDIVPVSQGAKLMNIIVLTPIRILFLVLLIGTTVEALFGEIKSQLKKERYMKNIENHIIICGFGVKGKSALQLLLSQEISKEQIIVIDSNPGSIKEATSLGVAGIEGDSSRREILKQASIENAERIIVTADKDDTAILTILNIRELNEEAYISAVVRDEGNAHLLRQSGANQVTVSSSTAGRIAALASSSPLSVSIIDDLLTLGSGLDLKERKTQPDEIGECPYNLKLGGSLLAVSRNNKMIFFDQLEKVKLQADDYLVFILHKKA